MSDFGRPFGVPNEKRPCTQFGREGAVPAVDKYGMG